MSQGRTLPGCGAMKKGLFLDFEGFAPFEGKEGKIPRPPAMVGYSIGWDGKVEQVVFSKTLRWAALGEGLRYEDSWKDFVTELVAGKPKFAFSVHEQKVIRLATGSLYESSYKNVKLIAKEHWPGGWPEGVEETLERFVEGSPFKFPGTYGRGDVTERLREVGKYGSTEKGWESAPERVKEQWKGVLAHNAFDVTILGKLLVWCKDSKESGTKPRADQ